MDWDLEAPGIEKYFERWLQGSRRTTPGIVELCAAYRDGSQLDWRNALLLAEPAGLKPISILTAGQQDDEYVQRLRGLDWDRLFTEHDFGRYLEQLRREWLGPFDFVLIDSRTGITDIGGICTIHLPDAVFAFYTANDESLEGVADVLNKARRAHETLPVDRVRLLVVPVPSRDESDKEYELAVQWRDRAATFFADFMADWLPRDQRPSEALNFIRIPYHAYWSFGERVPVLEEADPENPKTLAFAYQPLARLILSHFDWQEVRAEKRASEEAARQEAEAARLQKEAEEARARALAEERAQRVHEEERVERAIAEYRETHLQEVTGGLIAEKNRYTIKMNSNEDKFKRAAFIVLFVFPIAFVLMYVEQFELPFRGMLSYGEFMLVRVFTVLTMAVSMFIAISSFMRMLNDNKCLHTNIIELNRAVEEIRSIDRQFLMMRALRPAEALGSMFEDFVRSIESRPAQARFVEAGQSPVKTTSSDR